MESPGNMEWLGESTALNSQERLTESSAAPRRSAPPRRNVAQPQRSRSAATAQLLSGAAAVQPQRSRSAAAAQLQQLQLPQRCCSEAAVRLL